MELLNSVFSSGHLSNKFNLQVHLTSLPSKEKDTTLLNRHFWELAKKPDQQLPAQRSTKARSDKQIQGTTTLNVKRVIRGKIDRKYISFEQRLLKLYSSCGVFFAKWMYLWSSRLGAYQGNSSCARTSSSPTENNIFCTLKTKQWQQLDPREALNKAKAVRQHSKPKTYFITCFSSYWQAIKTDVPIWHWPHTSIKQLIH